MPKIVDHDQRRAELIKHVIAIVSREGLAGATMRSVARAAGFTSGVLSHYFTSKEEMVNFAFSAVAEQIYERIDHRLALVTGARDQLKIVMEELLPLSGRDEESIVTIIFWASAIHDPSLRTQFKRQYSQWRDYLKRILNDAARRGELPSSPPITTLIELLVAITDGLLVSWVMQPERMTRASRQTLIEFVLTAVGLSADTVKSPIRTRRRNTSA
jgi:AcrR family transcriptional regulator